MSQELPRSYQSKPIRAITASTTMEIKISVPETTHESLSQRVKDINTLAKVYGKKESIDIQDLIAHLVKEYVRSYGGDP